MRLIEPSCPRGYTSRDIYNMLGDEDEAFWHFMRGQTMSLCNGSTYDHDKKAYFTTACSEMLPGMPLLASEVPLLEGHGGIVYTWDFQRFVRGLPVTD
jgi:hypothetical protein